MSGAPFDGLTAKLEFDKRQGDRVCGSCTLCCRLVPVASLQKKAGQRCQHQRRSCGCSIYPKRPIDCRLWSCRWLLGPDTGDLRRPDASHYVIDPMLDEIRLTDGETGEVHTLEVIQVWVDVNYPEAWRDEALGRYIQRVAASGIATLIRKNNLNGTALFAPNSPLNPTGDWHLIDGGAPNLGMGLYSTLPPDERPPL